MANVNVIYIISKDDDFAAFLVFFFFALGVVEGFNTVNGNSADFVFARPVDDFRFAFDGFRIVVAVVFVAQSDDIAFEFGQFKADVLVRIDDQGGFAVFDGETRVSVPGDFHD